MKKLRVAACDDEPELLEIYARYIAECFAYHNITATVERFSDPLFLKRTMEQTTYDLLFLDIDMPKVDGITLAKELRRTGNNVDIIYISSKEELVFKVFDIQPYSFIRKNRFFEEIAGVVRSYVETHQGGNRRHLIIEQKQGDILTLDLNQTLYFEGDGKNQKAYLFRSDRPITVKSSMRELEEALNDQGFIRIHKGFLVNYQYIDTITGTSVLLTSGQELPLSRRTVNEVKHKYLNLMKWDAHVGG